MVYSVIDEPNKNVQMENITELGIIPSIQKKTPEMGAKGHTYI